MRSYKNRSARLVSDKYNCFVLTQSPVHNTFGEMAPNFLGWFGYQFVICLASVSLQIQMYLVAWVTRTARNCSMPFPDWTLLHLHFVVEIWTDWCRSLPEQGRLFRDIGSDLFIPLFQRTMPKNMHNNELCIKDPSWCRRLWSYAFSNLHANLKRTSSIRVFCYREGCAIMRIQHVGVYGRQ